MERLERTPVRRPAHEAPQQRRATPAGRRGAADAVLVAARIAASGLIIATGAIHLYLYQHAFSAVPTIGRLFVANFVVALVLGAALLVRGRPVWSLLGAGFCLGTLAAFLISVHWGLFGYRETLHGTWQERAAAVEAAGAVVSGLLTAWLVRAGRRRA
jgi:hypothetical protein